MFKFINNLRALISDERGVTAMEYGLIAGLIAVKVVKKSSPPVPSMAIEEAQKIRETVSAGADSHTSTEGKI